MPEELEVAARGTMDALIAEYERQTTELIGMYADAVDKWRECRYERDQLVGLIGETADAVENEAASRADIARVLRSAHAKCVPVNEGDADA